MELNEIEVLNNKVLKLYHISKGDSDEYGSLIEFVGLLNDELKVLGIEELIELFEFVLSPSDKVVNGAVYTPKFIREYIVTQVIERLEESNVEVASASFADISCGCGGFFYTIAERLRKNQKRSYYKIYKENLFGLDIQSYSIERTILLLTLIAVQHGEDRAEFEFNLYEGDALTFEWSNKCSRYQANGGFDAIVGNPPYVGAVKLSNETKTALKEWKVASSGKADLYIPFFQIGLEALKKNGVLGFISVNSFYRSLNGRGLREYVSSNEFDLQLVDFGAEQVFKGRSTYTCICLIQRKKGKVSYTHTQSSLINNLRDSDFDTVEYGQLQDDEGWLLNQMDSNVIVKKLESTGKALGSRFVIRNGFATLRNNIYLFKPIATGDRYYTLESGGKEFLIEKAICREAIKPNTLKTESEIEGKKEKLIFPYTIECGQGSLFKTKTTGLLKVIEERTFKQDFPKAYAYLSTQKDELNKRDKGSREYEAWYAYGRSQGLLLDGKKLLFPYIAKQPNFVFTNDEELLFYNGFAVIGDDDDELLVLQKILNSRLFWFYVSHKSRPYEGGFFSLGKRYVKNFGIPDLTNTESKKLLAYKTQGAIDRFLESKYGVTLPE